MAFSDFRNRSCFGAVEIAGADWARANRKEHRQQIESTNQSAHSSVKFWLRVYLRATRLRDVWTTRSDCAIPLPRSLTQPIGDRVPPPRRYMVSVSTDIRHRPYGRARGRETKCEQML